MFSFNNNKKDSDLLPQDLQELFQRLEHLEIKCRRLDARISELEEKIPESSTEADRPQENLSSANVQVEVTGITLDNDNTLPLLQEELKPTAKIFYLAAPTSDGVFSQATEQEQVGKSIYQLVTYDGQNGTFILLDTSDAIATAMISVSQFVKPACKICGNTALQPRHIITEEEGVATRENANWKISRKAVVRFE